MIDENIPVDFVGTLNSNFGGNPSFPNYQGQAFDRNHEGHWAWDTEDILYGYVCNEVLCPGVPGGSGLAGTWLNSYDADIALIHLGHNDLFRGWPTSRTITNLGIIIDELRGDNPNVVIFLSNLIPSTRVFGSSINNSLPGLIASKYTAQSPIFLVNNASGFSSTADTWDGIHPNASGEAKMALKFGDALVEYIDANDPPVVNAGTDINLTWPTLTTSLNGSVTDDGEPNPPGAVTHNWTWVSGPAPATVANPSSLTSSITLPAGGSYVFRLRGSDGETTLEDSVKVTVSGPCEAQPAHVAAVDGWTFFEAESHNGTFPGTGAGAPFLWGPATEFHNTTGEVVMQGLPSTGTWLGDTNINGPRMDYEISFPTSGVWYVWFRMRTKDGQRNSFHFGFNGNVQSAGGRAGVAAEMGVNQWYWVGKYVLGGDRVAVDVPTRGFHTMNIWVREAGVIVDKILLTRDVNAVPDGSIPATPDLGSYCDLDGDAWLDAWELSTFGSTLPLPGDDTDGDLTINEDEIIAGTDPNDILEFPQVITTLNVDEEVQLTIPAKAGRLYDVEYTEDIGVASPVWQMFQSDVVGIDGDLIIPLPAPPGNAIYRYTVRMAP